MFWCKHLASLSRQVVRNFLPILVLQRWVTVSQNLFTLYYLFQNLIYISNILNVHTFCTEILELQLVVFANASSVWSSQIKTNSFVIINRKVYGCMGGLSLRLPFSIHFLNRISSCYLGIFLNNSRSQTTTTKAQKIKTPTLQSLTANVVCIVTICYLYCSYVCTTSAEFWCV